MKLSIVITTRDRYIDLCRCLQSVVESNFGDYYEVIVVDDASHDATAAAYPQQLASISNLHIIRNTEQVMMVRARNQGARVASGEYVLFIDDDNEIAFDMLTVLSNYLDLNPQVGIVGPAMFRPGCRTPYLTAQKISLITGRTVGLIVPGKPVQASDGVPNVFMIRKALLESCGYFDEDIVQTYTEPDFAMSAARNGMRCEMLTATRTVHHTVTGSISSQICGNQFRQKAYFLIRNRILLVLRYGTTLQKLIFLFCFSWFWPLAYSFIALSRQRYDLIALYWFGFADGMRLVFGARLPSNYQAIDRVRTLMRTFSRRSQGGHHAG